MLVIRCYSVLDHHVTEVSCVGHSGEDHGSHLVFRTEQASPSPTLWGWLESVSYELQRAAWEAEHGDLDWYDECPDL